MTRFKSMHFVSCNYLSNYINRVMWCLCIKVLFPLKLYVTLVFTATELTKLKMFFYKIGQTQDHSLSAAIIVQKYGDIFHRQLRYTSSVYMYIYIHICGFS